MLKDKVNTGEKQKEDKGLKCSMWKIYEEVRTEKYNI